MEVYYLYLAFRFVAPILIVLGIVYFISNRKTVRDKSDSSSSNGSSSNESSEFTDEDGERMLKSVYTYLVLFATLMMSIGGSVGVFMGAADFIVPDPYVQSYDDYKNSNMNMYQESDEIREDYEIMVRDKMQQEQRGALKLIIQSTGWIAIPLPIFLYYQKQLKGKDDKRLE